MTPPFFKYGHDEEVTFEEDCGIGTGSVSALAFAEDDSFPAGPGPKGALVFGDYSRGCLWYLPPIAATASPTPATRRSWSSAPTVRSTCSPATAATLYYVGIGLGGLRDRQQSTGSATTAAGRSPS